MLFFKNTWLLYGSAWAVAVAVVAVAARARAAALPPAERDALTRAHAERRNRERAEKAKATRAANAAKNAAAADAAADAPAAAADAPAAPADGLAAAHHAHQRSLVGEPLPLPYPRLPPVPPRTTNAGWKAPSAWFKQPAAPTGGTGVKAASATPAKAASSPPKHPLLS